VKETEPCTATIAEKRFKTTQQSVPIAAFDGSVGGPQAASAPTAGPEIAGVCLGFAEYFDIDVTVVRLVWANRIVD